MARKRRFTIPGVPQHVIQRGHNREPCFYSDDDYHRYHRDLREAAEKNLAAINYRGQSTDNANKKPGSESNCF